MNKSKLGAALAVALGMAGLAHAAPISWSAKEASTHGSYLEILDTGLFDTSGTQVLAENLGGDALTFDGIDFTTSSRQFATGGPDSGLADTSQNLIWSGIYGINDTVGTVNLTGLTIGQEYRLQALVYDGRHTTTGRAVKFDDQELGVYAKGVFDVSWGPGLLATGTFTADTTEQSFTQTVFADPTYSENKGQTLNALTLYAIPEPATLGIVAMFGGVLLFMRRKLMV